MAKILVAGFGDIGARLAHRLNRQGHQVTGLRRNPPDPIDGPILYCRADLTRPDALTQLDSDFDQIFFMPAPDRRSPEAYGAVYLTGLDNLLQRYSARVRRPHWFLISSTSVYGQSAGGGVDEESPALPKSETAKIIRQAEHRLLVAAPDAVIVRFSGIYGPGRGHLLKMAERTPVVQREPPYFSNRIHQEDCASVLAFLSEQRLNGRRLENCYLASDDDPAPLWDVMSWLAAQTKRPPPIPQTVTDDPPNQNKRCCNARLKALGYRFRYPSYRDGYKTLLPRGSSI